MQQTIITAQQHYSALDAWLEGRQRLFLVCDDSIKFLPDIRGKLDEVRCEVVSFSDFQPNPLYESVVKGVKLFRQAQCDAIMAIGGGSAMDVAKCIKLYSNLPGDGEDGAWLKADIVPNAIPFLAMPTTAGTGSALIRSEILNTDIRRIQCQDFLSYRMV